MKDMTKVKELINKLLAVTVENGATENEVITATLKVQEILAKYDMNMADVQVDEKEDIVREEVDTKKDVWRLDLALIIANNFCCKVFLSRGRIVFYGYKRHCEVAKDVFTTIYNFGRKRASEIYKEYSRQGYDPRGIKNTFYMGFLAGVKNAFDVQSRALMIVVPQEVETAYNHMMVGAKTKVSHMGCRNDDDVYDRGVAAGREVAGQKVIA